MVLKGGVPLGQTRTLQDLKHDFEETWKILVGNIGLFSAGERVALNHTILVTPRGIEPRLPG